MSRNTLPPPEWTPDLLRSHPHINPAAGVGNNPTGQIAFALENIAAALCRIDHRLALILDQKKE